jgi:3-deoxy-7-phosphoheptulonate synthase
MILILSSNTNTSPDSAESRHLMARLAALPGIATRAHVERGVEKTLTEIYLIGDTKALTARPRSPPLPLG